MGVQNFEITFQGGEPDEMMVFNGGSTIVGTVRFTIDEKPKTARGRVKFFIFLTILQRSII